MTRPAAPPPDADPGADADSDNGRTSTRATIAVYEAGAAAWAAARHPGDLGLAAGLAARAAGRGGPRIDLGCGPGWHTEALGRPAIALDAARAMLDLVTEHAPEALRVQADLTRLPFAPGSLDAAFATRAHVHLDARAVPRALADLHRCLAPDAPIALVVFGSGSAGTEPTEPQTGFATDDFPGRSFNLWNVDLLGDVLAGAGFTVERLVVDPEAATVPLLTATATRRRTLPDTVGAHLRVLVCGLNPSLHAADAGVGFVTPGNRFWPAAIAAGLVSVDRDPFHALDHHRVGMTDLVKRATRRADELAPDEYRVGLARVERMVEWLEPSVVCFVGLAGYRAARDRRAVAGLQPDRLGGRPVYVMPSTSGLNAHSRLDDLTDHLVEVGRLADQPGP